MYGRWSRNDMKKSLWGALLYMPYISSYFRPFDVDFDDLDTLPEPKAEGRSPLDEEESLTS
jgi:nitrate reductase beta subunit